MTERVPEEQGEKKPRDAAFWATGVAPGEVLSISASVGGMPVYTGCA